MTYAPSDDTPKASNGRSEVADTAQSVWTVGAWRVDSGTGDLRRGSESLRVEPKVAEVLVYLAQRAGQVVSRDELLTAVWPGVVVGDDALTQAIIKLRKALGDDAKRPAYIETLAKRGYRLIAPVSAVNAPTQGSPATRPAVAEVAAAASPPQEAPPPAAASTTATSPARAKPWRLAAALAGGLAAITLATVLAVGIYRDWAWPIGAANTPRATAETLPVIAVLPLVNASGDPAREFFSDGVSDEIIHARSAAIPACA